MREMDNGKRKETIEKILALLGGLNYGEAFMVLERARDELEIISFVQPAHYPILQEKLRKRRDMRQQSLLAKGPL